MTAPQQFIEQADAGYHQGWAVVDKDGKITSSGSLPPGDLFAKPTPVAKWPTRAETVQEYVNRNTWRIGNAVYGTCARCGQTVHVNKFFFGSLHLCEPGERKAG